MQFKGLDLLPPNAKVAIYGSGERGLNLMKAIREDTLGTVVMFVDSFKEDRESTPPVIRVDNIISSDIEYDTLIIASSFYNAMLPLLAKAGLKPDGFFHDNGLTPYPDGSYPSTFTFEKERIRSFMNRFSTAQDASPCGACMTGSEDSRDESI